MIVSYFVYKISLDCFFLEEIAKFHGFVEDSGIHKCNNQRLYGSHRFISAVLVQCSTRRDF